MGEFTLQDRFQLRRVMAKVRLAAFHPRLHDQQGGGLILFLYSSSNQDAVKRFIRIVKQLPFEFVSNAQSGKAHFYVGSPDLQKPADQSAIEVAKILGICVVFAKELNVTDEGYFLDVDVED